MLSSPGTTDPTKIFILGEPLKILEPAFNYPICSSLLGEYCVEKGTPGDLVKFSLADMKMSDIISEIGDNSSGDEDMEITNFVIVNLEDENNLSAWEKVNPIIVPISFLSFENDLNDEKGPICWREP
ncbi:hypothetical protein QAD02_009252 [Eretmocerus hayati]|uniref:Uncharacterized protein n=1 Tax=Eretmocerus hayati TaxID=131215 RepID=A0ACC2N958_9HYME|nr:hypothetical protein QAD02_009252 [Eretmocerus hayati]